MPLFAGLTRNGQTIFLTEHSGDCLVGGAVYFQAADAAACHAEFSARYQRRPATRGHTLGRREMLLIDPDGNHLRFASQRV